MNRPELRRQLQALARRHPGIHPYTLALQFQAQSGKDIDWPAGQAALS
jgi:hypothetical protein